MYVRLVIVPAAVCLRLRTPSSTHTAGPPYSQAEAEQTLMTQTEKNRQQGFIFISSKHPGPSFIITFQGLLEP